MWYDKNLSRPRLLGPRKLLGSKILREGGLKKSTNPEMKRVNFICEEFKINLRECWSAFKHIEANDFFFSKVLDRQQI